MDNKHGYVMKRRTYIKSVGLATSGLPFAVSTAAADDSPTASEIGVRDEVADLLLEGDISEAEEILTSSDVPYDIQSQKVSAGTSNQDSSSDDPTITPDGHYTEDSSELYISVVSDSGDRWLVTTIMELAGRTLSARDAGIVPDGFGISYDSSEWSAPEPIEDGVITYVNSEKLLGASLNYQNFAPDQGLAYEVNLKDLIGTKTLSLQTELKQDGNYTSGIPVKASYKHTWAFVDGIGPLNPEVSVSIGPAGLVVDLDKASINFEAEVIADPGESSTS